ncbi:MAG: UDP-N-acetylmuramoyl-L-alanyl-D-glutamate--2,6-diaminopimelate ligase [Deltaproteobacteria bacterium]|nr:MAG: UDP-N-acetylmuramoyl-L-alanyl-D-glutamate--2,6-diaminopimelate ligase [Deltaproteobacteria bacterium]
MKLSKLLKSINPKQITGIRTDFGGHHHTEDPDIASIHYRAQDVEPSGMFVAIPGFVVDGHDFIDQAIQKGAVAVVAQKPVKSRSVIIEVDDTRKALAALAAEFYQNPAEHLFLIGITGTNGKTTTAYLGESVLANAGLRVGVIGTVNYRYAGKAFKSPVTTPESLDLQRILAEMRRHGITHVVLEVSSHALDLNRVEKCWLDVGVFTNLTQDHLDYHKDMDSYWACKKKLFTEYLPHGPKKDRAMAIINGDDPKGQELLDVLSIPCISTGLSPDRMIWPQDFRTDPSGITGRIATPLGAFNFTSPLVGKHNLENILSAVGIGLALKISLSDIKSGIGHTSFVPGRLERIQNDNGYYIYVDYAHTPDALTNVLSALSALKTHKIICVFGCGGDRDKEKRPQMGQIAGKFCDLSIITSDNPRSEEPMAIINQILEGTQEITRNVYTPAAVSDAYEHKGYVVEPDRRKAIRLAIAAARPGDTVLIAGKGHETYQIIGDKTIAFDDKKEAEKALFDRRLRRLKGTA